MGLFRTWHLIEGKAIMLKITFSFTGLGGMATLNKKIMTVLLCIAFLTLASSINAQPIEQISYQQFTKFSVNGEISVDALTELGSDWDQLKDALGSPLEEKCYESAPIMGFETRCNFFYDGLEIYYGAVGNGVELSKIELSNDIPFLQYEDTAIRVGDPISKLEPLFPQAYTDREPIHTATGETNYAIRLNVGSSIAYFSFTYDPINETITEILFHQILT
jgi:hypothetical protein